MRGPLQARAEDTLFCICLWFMGILSLAPLDLKECSFIHFSLPALQLQLPPRPRHHHSCHRRYCGSVLKYSWLPLGSGTIVALPGLHDAGQTCGVVSEGSCGGLAAGAAPMQLQVRQPARFHL